VKSLEFFIIVKNKLSFFGFPPYMVRVKSSNSTDANIARNPDDAE
jgi:hypothetical protein